MSEAIGLVSVLPAHETDGLFFPGAGTPSERMRERLGDEVRRITDDCYAEALATLREHQPKLEALATALLEHEMLDELDAYRAACVGRPAQSPDRGAVGTAMPG